MADEQKIEREEPQRTGTDERIRSVADQEDDFDDEEDDLNDEEEEDETAG